MGEALLVEVRCEELPPAQVRALEGGFVEGLCEALVGGGFVGGGGEGVGFAAPRRFAALVDGVAEVAVGKTVVRRGPPVAACWEAAGVPSAALKGFMRAVGGRAVEELGRVTEKGREYVCFSQTLEGEALGDRLAAMVEQVLLRWSAPRLMRWGTHEFKFVRPLRGVLMMHGAAILEGQVLGVAAGAGTVGHPVLGGGGEMRVRQAREYARTMEEEGWVVVEGAARRRRIVAGLREAAEGREALVGEVAAMCEWPAVYEGRFEAEFLTLPDFCVVGCLVKHQRVFPVCGEEGGLDGRYRFVADNAPANPAAMIAGFDAVLRARLRDLAFYYHEDKKVTVEAALEKLNHIVYHRRLGSQRARVERLVALVEALAVRLGLDGEVRRRLRRAVELCKCDLSTLMVGEYPELEGRMAAEYFCGEEEGEVAEWVRGHAAPDWGGAGGAAKSEALAAFYLALQLEKLVGMFAVGETPTGSKDPHGLRAAAVVVADILSDEGGVGRGWTALPLEEVLSDAAGVFEGEDFEGVTAEVGRFVRERRRGRLAEEGIPAAVLNAVFASPPVLMVELAGRARALAAFLTLPQAAALCEAHKRVNNILRKAAEGGDEGGGAVRAALFVSEAERRLLAAMEACERVGEAAGGEGGGDYRAVLAATAELHGVVGVFFDEVMVNCDEAALRRNRLALLARLRAVFNRAGDLAKLSGG